MPWPQKAPDPVADLALAVLRPAADGAGHLPVDDDRLRDVRRVGADLRPVRDKRREGGHPGCHRVALVLEQGGQVGVAHGAQRDARRDARLDRRPAPDVAGGNSPHIVPAVDDLGHQDAVVVEQALDDHAAAERLVEPARGRVRRQAADRSARMPRAARCAATAWTSRRPSPRPWRAART